MHSQNETDFLCIPTIGDRMRVILYRSDLQRLLIQSQLIRIQLQTEHRFI
ncbi:hypothetical protein LguiA_035982 [Lonicera macranthoides]